MSVAQHAAVGALCNVCYLDDLCEPGERIHRGSSKLICRAAGRNEIRKVRCAIARRLDLFLTVLTSTSTVFVEATPAAMASTRTSSTMRRLPRPGTVLPTLPHLPPAPAPRLVQRPFASASPSSPLPSSSATSPNRASPLAVFDRHLKSLHRSRAASQPEVSRLTDYVKDEVAAGMVDRLLDIRRKYEEVVELGSGAGHVVKELGEETGTKRVVLTDHCGACEVKLQRWLGPTDVQLSKEKMLRRDEGHASYDGTSRLLRRACSHLWPCGSLSRCRTDPHGRRASHSGSKLSRLHHVFLLASLGQRPAR